MRRHFPPRWFLGIAAFAGLVLLLAALVPSRPRTVVGATQPLGSGTVGSYLTLSADGTPLALGVRLAAGALEGLPPAPNTRSRCFDLDGDGRHTGHECIGDEERILELPAEAAAADLPFRWIMVNWNPGGHHAPYARPHFDFHFYTEERHRIEAIGSGRCGELADCDDFERAVRPIEEPYLPEGHINVGAVVARMGNHLLDSRSPELTDSLTPFTRTFIYGAFDGELIFWEPMITLDFLQATRDACFEIRQPRAVRQSGYYPTRYCVRQDGETAPHTVSLEGFTYAEAR